MENEVQLEKCTENGDAALWAIYPVSKPLMSCPNPAF